MSQSRRRRPGAPLILAFLLALPSLVAFAHPEGGFPTGCPQGDDPQTQAYRPELGSVERTSAGVRYVFNPLTLCAATATTCRQTVSRPACCVNACRQLEIAPSDWASPRRDPVRFERYLACAVACPRSPDLPVTPAQADTLHDPLPRVQRVTP